MFHLQVLHLLDSLLYQSRGFKGNTFTCSSSNLGWALVHTYMTVGLDDRFTGSHQQGLNLNVLRTQATVGCDRSGGFSIKP